ncbi:hypothetical protein ND861_09590 [Leptospira sp. 2 VSF19]|uniref:Replication protein n=1 Tax=Leptospira soteropolitanensis TaxID=2950025 RepID=A0AAW5VN40_9LEPT|nr:hypothetical protein [Leptospira soteropolitanensis]MCW7492542.1 hypothetical protein [Leptospira soteropolitanensis]MCW7500590.1 hypothetical protein [Leptospira soteropolitanensis]MCW7522740.1 hypothetical protein [Leptospira soteropolitanensis]MCW7526596.1 hypothetical protein [Leptospira soteropolitanensis]MCW7530560.1 hypothetical protein [Leptospira soteropolitanensis]
MAKLCPNDTTKQRLKNINLNRICEAKWKKLQLEYGNESMNIRDVKRVTNRTTWNCLKEYNKKNQAVYSKRGYTGYVFTLTRGDKEADMKELKEALRKTLKRMNYDIYKNHIKGLELPITTFEGNAIDGQYNPHLHGYVFIPKGEVRNFKRKLKENLANTLFNLPRLNGPKRKANKLWFDKIKGDGVKYFGYCGREESPEHGKELDKLDWDLSSFGFVSEPNHYLSKRIIKRIYRRFPETETNSELFHRVICMLHWIHKRGYLQEYLSAFIPPFETIPFPRKLNAKKKRPHYHHPKDPNLTRIPNSNKSYHDRVA